MEAHGGSIWLASSGSGAEFVMEIPLDKAGSR
jgi:signal transduction histidine kinase